MIKSVNTVKIYEVDDKECMVGGDLSLQVESHWNRDEFVVLRSDDALSMKITVLRRDLEAAIKNATNIAKY